MLWCLASKVSSPGGWIDVSGCFDDKYVFTLVGTRDIFLEMGFSRPLHQLMHTAIEHEISGQAMSTSMRRALAEGGWSYLGFGG
jgi:hypothetical protein